ncbi:glycosyltransferase [Paracoccus sp. IB05]|uniref:glycosyltransferase n=1 Tax=Paracoccus sp. IB05 TaxID=2779367 RepID=UPI0018E89663|nr:glycosyltransferase [Paracoccus sp. IB05]MBJ2151016.1 glycosyltransferase [Paracoccus sp. IB05]
MREICILLASYNGATWLPAQLDSIAAQSHQGWRLVISDDGSRDATTAIIRSFAASRPEGQVSLIGGPGRGACANFRFLLRGAGDKGCFLAFADQDDVWLPDRLERGLAVLRRAAAGQPAICGNRLRYVDAGLGLRGLSPLPRRPLSFRNALVQNVLSGNTMLINPEAARLLHRAEAGAPAFPLHDWWACQVVTGAGGCTLFDPEPNLLYRQHGSNLVGSNRGPRSILARLRRYLGPGYTDLARQNLAALTAARDLLTPSNRAVLDLFAGALDAPWPQKIALMRRSGVYYQSRGAQAAFRLLVALGRI